MSVIHARGRRSGRRRDEMRTRRITGEVGKLQERESTGKTERERLTAEGKSRTRRGPTGSGEKEGDATGRGRG